MNARILLGEEILILKKILKAKYSLFIFISITIFTSLVVSTYQSLLSDAKTSGNYISENATLVDFENINSIPKEIFLNSIYKIPNINIEKKGLSPGAFGGKAVYYASPENESINMISGRFFTNEDFKVNKPVAIVGKEVLKTCTEKNNKTYFIYDNIEYEVIGVMGFANRSSLSDLKFTLNLNSYIEKHPLITDKSFVFYSYSNNNVFDDFISEIEKSSISINYELKSIKSVNNSIKNSLLMDGFNVTILLIILILLISVNIINVTIQWVEKNRKAISIKKAIGATNSKILVELILNYQLISCISFIIGMIVYVIIIKTNVISIFNADIYFASSFIVFLITSFIAFLVSLIAGAKTLKIKPAIVMKEA